jgi:hypothetical protein
MKIYIKLKKYILYFFIILITFILIYNIFYKIIIREEFSLGGAGKSLNKAGKSIGGAGKSAGKSLGGAGKSIEKTGSSGLKSVEKGVKDIAKGSTGVVKDIGKGTTKIVKDVGKGIQKGVTMIEDTINVFDIEAELQKLFNSILKLGKIFEKLPNQVTSMVDDTKNLKLNITKELQNI